MTNEEEVAIALAGQKLQAILDVETPPKEVARYKAWKEAAADAMGAFDRFLEAFEILSGFRKDVTPDSYDCRRAITTIRECLKMNRQVATDLLEEE